MNQEETHQAPLLTEELSAKGESFLCGGIDYHQAAHAPIDGPTFTHKIITSDSMCYEKKK